MKITFSLLSSNRKFSWICLAVIWAAEIIRDELGHLTEEISKESFEGVALFLLVSYGKIGEEREIGRSVEHKGNKTRWFGELANLDYKTC